MEAETQVSVGMTPFQGVEQSTGPSRERLDGPTASKDGGKPEGVGSEFADILIRLLFLRDTSVPGVTEEESCD